MKITLLECRINKGWSIKQASERSDVSTSVIKRYEQNNSNANIITVHRLLAAYGMSLDHLKIDTTKKASVSLGGPEAIMI